MPIETAIEIYKKLKEKLGSKPDEPKPLPSGYIKKRTVDPDTGEVTEKNSMMVKKHKAYSETLCKD